MSDRKWLRLITCAIPTAVLAVGIGTPALEADIVRFKTGQVKEGTVTEETETTVKFKTEVGTITLPKDMIISVEYTKEAPQDDTEGVEAEASSPPPEGIEREPKPEEEPAQSRPTDAETIEAEGDNVGEEPPGPTPVADEEGASKEELIAEAIADHRVMYGMTEEQVRQSMGEPEGVRRPLFGNRVWVYSLDGGPAGPRAPGATRLMFIYFEKGKVYYVSEVRHRRRAGEPQVEAP